MDGTVPESVFVEQVRALGLGDVERERLREELAGLGLPVLRAVAHADGDGSNAEKVARIREEIVPRTAFPSSDVVRALLDRYADAEGYVTPLALDGVARLAGLSARDAVALRAGARIRGEAVATAEVAVAGGAVQGEVVRSEAAASMAGDDLTDLTDLTDAGEREFEGVPEGEPFPHSETATGGGLGDLMAAVAAALTVLENDRFRRRPDTRLLSAEAEVGLAVLLRGGPDPLAEEPDDGTLSGLRRDDLRIRARDCLVLHNQRLVHKMVPRFLGQGLDYEDLFQHGVLGLMRAARKFDPAKGFKFSTYATWWVRQSISRAIADEGAVIRIPVHMHEQIRKVALAERTLAVQGRPAGVADIAVYCDMTMQKVEEARRLSRRTDSLDRVIGDGVTLGDFIGRANPLPPVEKVVLDAMLLEQVMEVVATLSDREALILVRRLGLDGDEPSTLDELGRQIGRTRERVRQIETKAKKKFRYRLVTAGLTAAYQYEGGLAAASDMAPEPADVQESGSGAGAPKKKSSGVKRTLDALPGPAPKQAEPEVLLQPVETEEALDDERCAPTTVAEPHDPTSFDDALLNPLQDPPPPEVLTAPPAEPEQRADHGYEKHAGGPSAPEAVDAELAEHPADWQKALRMPTGFGGGVGWLAEYALLALGHAQLTVLLGVSSADAVVRAARARAMLDRPLITALEVLQSVFDAVKKAGLTPEAYFERPAAELGGNTPLRYLAQKPLVHRESRVAARAALRSFIADTPSIATPESPAPDNPRTEHLTRAHARAEGVSTQAEAPCAGASEAAQHERGCKGSLDMPAVAEDGPRSPSIVDRADDETARHSGEPRERAAGQQGASPRDGRGQVGWNREETDSQTDQSAPADECPRTPNQADTVRQLVARQAAANPRPADERATAEEAQTGLVADAEPLPNVLQRAGEAEPMRGRDEDRRHLAEERQAADAVGIESLTDTEQQLDALEEALLRRTDKALLRKERHVRAQAEERIARLRDEHREAQRTLAERAERTELRERTARTALAAAVERGARAEQRARDAEQHAHDAEQRASTGEERAAVLYQRANEAQRRAEETGQRLRRYTEEGETRIAGLEQRLRQAEALLAERDAALRAAQQQASDQVAAAEQRAAARIAQTEHDAWARITELQQQLAAESEAAADRSTLRNRWRRS
ncbi:sigma-70 family RNA polymerase sigma factor [Streptomyces soliscabiei]|uniref:sigma-70 family RNA polymerase sigma factor n=1 Tax=Streptomyces soliscabiei TaxID=588897 RepID=UPI0029A7AD08|nr:sigma-70 family RNA polymerase sigma factor [Streptomyces sp. NY05-11A]MDX2682468.1 sigma-70 family RNA polymerase sigma factor [Streptomyces sp. NY05-11A]